MGESATDVSSRDGDMDDEASMSQGTSSKS